MGVSGQYHAVAVLPTGEKDLVPIVQDAGCTALDGYVKSRLHQGSDPGSTSP
jgi:hypothetical protein